MNAPLFLIQLLISLSLASMAQNNVSTGYQANEKDKKQKILEKGKNYDVNFDISNHEAFFLEGEDSLFRLIYAKLEIPVEAADQNLSGDSEVSFQVNFDGKVSEIYSVKKVGFGIDEQINAILKQVEFVPATQGDIPIRSNVMLQVPVKAGYLYNLKKQQAPK